MTLYLALAAAALASAIALFFALRHRAMMREFRALRASRREVETLILRKSEGRRNQLLESVFQALGDACLLVGQDLGILLANGRVRDLFELPAIPVARKLPEVLLDHRFVDISRRCLDERRVIESSFEVRVKRESGVQNMFLVVKAAPVRIYGEALPQHLCLIIRDVTVQRETEQIRKDFVANASHELRTPLSIINGYIENLVDGVVEDAEATRRALITMQKHGDRIARIVEDMLTISKFESTGVQGASDLRATTFDCRACVEDVVERLAPVIEAKSAEILVEMPDGGEATVSGDRFYWDQIFFNLIENALKENSRDGLVIGVTYGRDDDGSVEIAVKDNGVGIPSADLNFVFKRFYRVAKHHSQEVKGTGLGLSIVKRAVEAHGGTISLTSTPGVETAFHISLPPRPEPEADPELADEVETVAD
ncbi:hypothetical protein BH23VER1_BH23VER1_28140 [soil metagenome]